MKLFIVIYVLLFPAIGDSIYIKSTKTDKHSFTINFTDNHTVRCKINRDKRKRYFVLDTNVVYIDVDRPAIPDHNVDSLIKSITIRPDTVVGYLPMLYLTFILNKEGKIIYKGLRTEFIENDAYQREFFRLMTKVNCNFSPAINNKKNVASVLNIAVNYNALYK